VSVTASPNGRSLMTDAVASPSPKVTLPHYINLQRRRTNGRHYALTAHQRRAAMLHRLPFETDPWNSGPHNTEADIVGPMAGTEVVTMRRTNDREREVAPTPAA